MRQTGNGVQNLYGTLRVTVPAGLQTGVTVDGGVSVNASNPNLACLSASGSIASVSVCGNGGAPGSTSIDIVCGTSNDGYLYNRANGPLSLGTNNIGRVTIAAGGNVAVNAPVTGTGITVAPSGDGSPAVSATGNIVSAYASTGAVANGAQNTSAAVGAYALSYAQNNVSRFVSLVHTGSNFAGTFLTGGPSGESAGVYTSSVIPLSLGTNAIERVRISSGGAVTINNPTSGVPLSIYEQFNSINAVKTAATFETGTFTGTLTGVSGGPVTGNIAWTRVGAMVYLSIGGNVTGTSNATTLTMTGIPAALQPVKLQQSFVTLFNNGTSINGWAQVASGSGTMTFTDSTGNPSGFTASGSKGIYSAFSVTYSLN